MACSASSLGPAAARLGGSLSSDSEGNFQPASCNDRLPCSGLRTVATEGITVRTGGPVTSADAVAAPDSLRVSGGASGGVSAGATGGAPACGSSGARPGPWFIRLTNQLDAVPTFPAPRTSTPAASRPPENEKRPAMATARPALRHSEADSPSDSNARTTAEAAPNSQIEAVPKTPNRACPPRSASFAMIPPIEPPSPATTGQP